MESQDFIAEICMKSQNIRSSTNIDYYDKQTPKVAIGRVRASPLEVFSTLMLPLANGYRGNHFLRKKGYSTNRYPWASARFPDMVDSVNE